MSIPSISSSPLPFGPIILPVRFLCGGAMRFWTPCALASAFADTASPPALFGSGGVAVSYLIAFSWRTSSLARGVVSFENRARASS